VKKEQKDRKLSGGKNGGHPSKERKNVRLNRNYVQKRNSIRGQALSGGLWGKGGSEKNKMKSGGLGTIVRTRTSELLNKKRGVRKKTRGKPSEGKYLTAKRKKANGTVLVNDSTCTSYNKCVEKTKAHYLKGVEGGTKKTLKISGERTGPSLVEQTKSAQGKREGELANS